VRQRDSAEIPNQISKSKGGIAAARLVAVQTASDTPRKVAANPDIFFQCDHCKAALVVNCSAAGLNSICQHCGKPTLVPKPAEPTADTATKLREIDRKLKENESQRTEVTGYINQLSIQLHRWQLRLQTLNDRKAQLEKDQRD